MSHPKSLRTIPWSHSSQQKSECVCLLHIQGASLPLSQLYFLKIEINDTHTFLSFQVHFCSPFLTVITKQLFLGDPVSCKMIFQSQCKPHKKDNCNIFLVAKSSTVHFSDDDQVRNYVEQLLVPQMHMSENNFNFPMLIWSSTRVAIFLCSSAKKRMQQVEPLVMEVIMPNETASIIGFLFFACFALWPPDIMFSNQHVRKSLNL